MPFLDMFGNPESGVEDSDADPDRAKYLLNLPHLSGLERETLVQVSEHGGDKYAAGRMQQIEILHRFDIIDLETTKPQ